MTLKHVATVSSDLDQMSVADYSSTTKASRIRRYANRHVLPKHEDVDHHVQTAVERHRNRLFGKTFEHQLYEIYEIEKAREQTPSPKSGSSPERGSFRRRTIG